MSDTATVVSPQQPQTTVQAPGGPFIRYSEPGKARIYDLTGYAFGGLINQPLTAIPGYVARFRLYFKASGGLNGTTGNTQGQPDTPYNIVQLVTLWDALGTPIVSGPGFEVFRLIPMFSGGFGLDAVTDPANLPSFSPINSGTSGTGNFTFASCIPLEFMKGLGVLGMADGDVLPKLQIQLATSAAVYTTAPSVLPTVEVRLNADYYWLPVGQSIAPVGLGSSRQWFLQQGNPTISSGGTSTVTIPRQGGWLDTMIFILRDANSARVDGWPAILRFNIDGIGEIEREHGRDLRRHGDCLGDRCVRPGERRWWWTRGSRDDSHLPPRPTGVLALSRKTSVSQRILGLLDTYKVAMSTSPGTSMAIEGAPWGTIAASPGTLNALLGQVIPSGALVQGLPSL